jgi:menaquinone-dependent protoporphyrinogen IX oxidase
MKKTLVVYYSRKGSNAYLAKQISDRLQCDMERIRPRVNVFLFFLMKINFGIRRMQHRIEEYDRVIMCGPIFMGMFIPPLRSFVTRHREKIRSLVFVTCCGSTYEKKDDKFGHGHVFRELQGILKEKCERCEAFPISLVMPDEQKDDPDAFMKTHLSDENFKGEIRERLDRLMKEL